MNWYIVEGAIYSVITIGVCLRILYDIRSTTKTLAYLLLTIFLPIAGMVIYFAVGNNYRKNKLYSKKIASDKKIMDEIARRITHESEKTWAAGEDEIMAYKNLTHMLLNEQSPLTGNNEVKLLLNGEEKFPAMLEALKAAKNHIHIEYYIFEDGNIGNQIKDVLVQKAAEGVKVRFIYDDFGSRSIRKEFVRELTDAGVEALPFYKIWFIAMSNRTNYRNHRKIVVIDGCVGFVGGINVSDRYINDKNYDQVYWRDTHVKIVGPGVYYLQNIFICDWNFCTGKKLPLTEELFAAGNKKHGKAIVQIAASGPDSDVPTIMFSLLQAIGSAKEELLITSPYFIPGDSILDALCIAAMSGVKVKLLVPWRSDSGLVNAAARSFYNELLEAGAEVYRYKKGFVHAKTLVADELLTVIGTANMDHRSFELNFEVNSMIYDKKIAAELKKAFHNDLKNAEKIDPKRWAKRSVIKQLPEKLCRLLSPLL